MKMIERAALLSCFLTVSGLSYAQTKPVDLGTALSFAVLGASAVTNTGPSVIDGDLGLYPGTSITGFPPGTVNGTTYNNDAVAGQAQADALTCYNFLAGLAPNLDLSGQDLGGKTFQPGVYKFDSSAGLTGQLTLDFGGKSDQVIVFQIGSSLTTASASSVLIIGAGQDDNVFWQVGSSATLGTTTAFQGSIFADASITLNTGATIEPCGRAVALTGAVTLDDNTIKVGGCQYSSTGGSGGGTTGTPIPEPSPVLLLTSGLIVVVGAALIRGAGARV
ncbi:MAG TPA: ice-binding family protein [Terriglobia bacterium]|nr:ice-binding family protein [Terriglobia bacterium]